MENKNTIIALALMMAVWFGFTILFPSSENKDNISSQSAELAPQAVEQDKSPEKVNDFYKTQKFSHVEKSTVSLPITVETSKYIAEFNSANASLVKFELKNYTEGPGKDSPPVTLVGDDKAFPGTLLLNGFDGFDFSDNSIFYSSLSGKKLLLKDDDVLEIPFETTTPHGLKVVKTYVLTGDRYDFNLNVSAENINDVSMGGYFTLSLLNSWNDSMGESRYEFNGPATLLADEIDNVQVKDLEEGEKKYGKEARWTSFQTKYFMNACVPLDSLEEALTVQKDDQLIINSYKTEFSTIQPSEKISLGFLIYFGPRDLDLLKESGNDLDKAIDFGFFSIIALPLSKVLKFFYSFLGNYGFAIILLTVIIKALFWPLTQKSYASMKSMQKLQPEMQKLRERFKNDRERMNREIMELYKKHRVNPLGGCLPMLVQIPVFFALYKVLLDTIDLRHAPFALWITDLSAKDPYYVTPIIMGATMFLQQKMTPSTMDPAQARIMMFLPIIFTFLFLNFPSGLVIYWMVNNVLTIVQQYFINKSHAH